MSILCRLGQHEASPHARANGGIAFGRCRGCGRDLILSASGWRPVPRGYRIVWRAEPPERAADPAQLPLDLPGAGWLAHGAPRIARPAAPPPRRATPRTGRSIAPPTPSCATA